MSNKYKVGDKVKIISRAKGYEKYYDTIQEIYEVYGIGIADTNRIGWLFNEIEPYNPDEASKSVSGIDLVSAPHYIEQHTHPATKKCTCGIAAIGGGIHSDWCDLSESK